MSEEKPAKKESKWGKRMSTIAIIYFMIGLVFAFIFAIYYKWGPLSFFSPGFYFVIATWPLQLPGFIKDLLYYGLAGKPI